MTSSDTIAQILSTLNTDSIRTYVSKLDQKGATQEDIIAKLGSVQKLLEWAYYSDKISFSHYQQIKDEIDNLAPLTFDNASPEASIVIDDNNNSLSDHRQTERTSFLDKISPFKSQATDKPKDTRANSGVPSIQNRSTIFISAALLLVAFTIIGQGIYGRFFSNTKASLAYPSTPVVASRILSFQGRLTDSLGNPITASTNMRFRLYTASSGGTTLYDSGTCSIAPDQDGVHNVLIGSDCGSEVASSVFTENGSVYLGVTVGSDSEMTPRQRMANVPYAQNSETLQGLPLGKDASSVPYINNGGDLLISAASPQIGSTYASQAFLISSAQAVTVQSAGAGDVTLTATGSGELKFLVGGATAGVVNNSGNWGIKSSNPSTFELQVNGDVGPETDSAFDLGSNSVRWANVYADNLVGTISPGFTTGSVTFADGSGNLAQDNAQFFWDDTANKLGIGTPSPLGKFHLTGAATGKALAILNETGDQNILTASASGTTVANLDRSGNLSVEGALSDLSGATLEVNDNLDISGTLTSGTANAFVVDATGNISTSGTTGLSFTSTGGIVLAGGTLTDSTDGVDINDDLEIAGGTTLGDASGDTVTANAASWTFANDTNYILSGGINGLSLDSTTFSVDATNDRIGIGTAAPDAAWLDIAAATTAKAQLNLTTSGGTNVSSPNSGDLWWNGTNLYFYNGSTNNDLLSTGSSVAGSDTQVQYNNGGVLGGASALIYDDVNNRVGIGTATAPTSLFHVAGATTGKALAIFNETGDQNILTASASGTTIANLDRSGNLAIEGSLSDLTGAVLNIDDGLSIAGNTTFGDASGDTVTSNAAAWTFANDTTVALSGGLNGLNFDSNTLSIDAANDRVGVGTAAPSGKFTIEKDNTASSLSTLTDGHLVLNNPNASGQTMMMFAINGVSKGGVRGDYQGNFNWHASGSQGHQFYGSIDNSTPILGMSGSGLQIGGAAGDVSAAKLNVNGNAAIGYAVSQTAPANGLLVSGTTGIGTTGPDAKLDVLATTEQLRLTYSDGSAYSSFTTSSAGDLNIDVTGNDITSPDRLTVGSATAGVGKLTVTGAETGKALAIFNETGDQALLTASASGTTRYTLSNNGNITYSPSAFGSPITLYDTDTTLPNANTGIVDAINDAYTAAIGGGGGLWTDSGTTTYLTTTTDDIVIGGSAPLSSGKLSVDGDADQIQLIVQGNGTQTSSLAVFEQSDGTDVLTISNAGNLVFAGGTLSDTSDGVDIADDLEISGGTTLGDASGDTVTANAAAWTFANDTTVALSGGLNGLNFDSNTLSIDAANDKIGIGTAAPVSKFHVTGAVTGKALAIFDETGDQDIIAASSSGSTRFRVSNDGTVYAGYLLDISNTAYGIDPAGTTNFGGYSMKITGGALLAADSGNVGIGDQTPDAKLNIQATTEQLRLDYDDSNYTSFTVGSGGDLTIAPTGGDMTLTGKELIYSSTAADSTLLKLHHDVWTTEPNGTVNLEMSLQYTNATIRTGVQSNGDNSAYISFRPSTDNLGNFAEVMRVEGDNQRVGIGTTGPDAKLDSLATSGEQLRLTYTDGSAYTGFTVASSGDLTLDSTGGDINLADADVLNIGGNADDVAFSAIGDDTASAGNVNSDNDLYIEDDLEVDGTIFGNITGTITPGFTAGSVVFTGSSGELAQDNASFFFDDTNNKFGLGTASPTGKLTVTGAATGKALAIFNETGDQNIISASASGTTVANLDRSGNLAIEGTLSDLGGSTLDISDNLDVTGTLTSGTANAFVVDGTGNISTSGTTGLTFSSTGGITLAGGTITDGTDGVDINDDLEIAGGTTLGDNIADTVTSNAGAWTFANDTTVALSGGVNGLNFDSNTLSIDATNNRIGIGTAAPSYQVNSVQTVSGPSSAQYNIYSTLSNNTASASLVEVASIVGFAQTGYSSGTDDNFYVGVKGIGQSAATGGSTASVTGVRGVAQMGNVNTTTNLYGGRFSISHDYGTVTNAYGVLLDHASSGSTTLTNRYGGYAANPTGAGTITNNYGLYIAGQTAGATADIGLYIADADTYSLQLASTDGDAASGITFGTDTNLFRSAANTLHSDDALDIDGNFITDGNTTLGNASGDTVTANAAAWTFANDTTVALTGGTDGINFDSNTLSIDGSNDRIGIGTAAPSAKIHSLATTEQLRLGYDVSNYASFTTSSGGDLTIAPSGSDTNITGNLAVSGNTGLGDGYTDTTTITGKGIVNLDTTSLGNNDHNALSINASTSTSTATTLRGLNLSANYSATSGTQTGMNGLDFTVQASGNGGTITTMKGISAWGIVGTGATVGTFKLSDVANPSNSGTITSLSGYSVDNLTSGTNNTLILAGTTTVPSGNWGIYNSSSYSNYLSGTTGIGTTGPDAKLDVLSTTEQLRLTYSDGSAYSAFTVSSGGDLTIDPTGGNIVADANINPNSHDTYDLGTDGARWRDLYLGPDTLHVGTSTTDEGTLKYVTSTNVLTLTNNYGDTDFGSTSDGFNFTLGGGAGDDFIVDATTLVVESDNDRVGIGTAAPDATWLDIAAATTGKAQINLTTSGGTDVSAPGSGDLWWNGTNLYFYNGSINKDLLAAGGAGPWTDGGSYVYTTAGEVLNLGGVTGTAYHAISDSGTTSHGLASDDDLYVEGDFELDGTLWADGSITSTGTVTGADITCTDCLDFAELEDTLDLDASLTLNQGTNTWTQNFTGDTTTGLTYNANSLSTGTAVAINSTSTAYTAATLLSLDWSPGSLTTSSDDLFKISTTNNGNLSSAYYINLIKQGSSIFNIAQSGNVTTTGDIAINGDDITSDGDLTVDAAGGQFLLADADTINIGGVSALAYNAIADSGGATSHSLASDDDLFVEGDVEVNGSLFADGETILTTVSGAGLSDCDSATSILLWDSTAKQFSCGRDNDLVSIAWSDINVAASLTDSQLDRPLTTILTSSVSEVYVPFAGNIVGISVAGNAARTNGSATFTVFKNDATTGFTCVIDGTNTQYNDCTQASGTDTFSAGDYIDVRVTTDLAWAPAGSTEFTVDVWIEMDTGADVAELYNIRDGSIKSADIVSIDPTLTDGVMKSTGKYDSNIVGVIATKPGVLLGEHDVPDIGASRAVALTGRVPVRVTTENGPIRIGDAITSSSIPGVGMKSTRAARVVGRALSEWDNPDPNAVGTVMLFVEPAYDARYILTDVAEFFKDAQQTIIADSIMARTLIADTFSSTKATIVELVTTSLSAESAKITDADIERLNAEALKVQEIEAEKIKTKTLETESLNTSDIASTNIQADRIVAESIDAKNITEMRERLERLAASQSDSTVTSEQLDADLEQVQEYIDELTDSQSPVNITDVETYQLSPENIVVDPGNTETALGENISTANLESLIVTGTATMTSLTVADAFSAGNIFIQNNSVVSMVNELKLTALETVDIMNGGVIIAKDGTLTAKGEVIAQKGIRTDTIKPLDGGSDVSVILNTSNATDPNSSFKVQNSDGNDVALIDSNGSADFKNLSLSTYSEATSSAVVIAARDNYRLTGLYAPAIKTNAAASGNGILPSGENDIIVFNDLIKKDTIVNLTPTSSSDNQSVYIDKVEACLNTDNELCKPYFRIAIDNTISKDVTFNWLLVN